ncbi:MAG TPA: TolC family protein [Planctomycetaceae bacterium]|nr:TolC family protein [Planctomycetaceae bacterium]
MLANRLSWRAPLVVLALLCSVTALVGCSRSHYRRSADQEARQLVLQKAENPRWSLDDFTVEMDPRSRYFNPWNPDYPPMPPDDPYSHELMHCVYGMRGSRVWHRDYEWISELENPGWRESLDEYVRRTDGGAYFLTLEQAVHLGLVHSPGYQQQLETLYLSALDVSTERFAFDVQFFGGTGLMFENLGNERPGGPSSTLTMTPFLDARKQFATAGELLVGIANTTVWQFHGPDQTFTTSLIDFTLIQPLLRRAGREIALEQLTIAERGLLANVRAYERYRHGFYTQIAIGDLGVQGPQRRGGFFGATGLSGFTGQGAGGFGGVGEATGFGRGGFGGGDGGGAAGAGAGFAGGGAGTVGGYIGLLQQLQQIRNTEASLNAQLRTLALLEANFEAGLIDLVQVDQFRQSIETERANLLQAQNSLQNSLDQFKAILGLPPDVLIELDDALIRPFQFIDPATTALQNQIVAFIGRFGELPREPLLEDLRDAFREIEALRDETAGQIDATIAVLDATDSLIEQRRRFLSDNDAERLRRDLEQVAGNLRQLQAQFRETRTTLEQLEDGLTPENRQQTADAVVALLARLDTVVAELGLVQARTRLEAVAVEPIELESAAALEIARANRLDWMNNRAALVDTWRLIEFNANALESQLNVVFSGDLRTIGNDNPVKFRGPTGRLTAQLQFDAPLTRLIERNNFRQQLINYQQARRQLVQFEDTIHRGLRQNLRTLEQLRTNLEIQRRAVAIAIRRVDLTREDLNRPVPPAEPGQPPAQLGATVAVNLLTALSDLRTAQNNFMSVWLNYHAARMVLYRDLGVMRIDVRGLWIDEPLSDAIRASAADCPLPPEIPEELWKTLEDSERAYEERVPPAPIPPDGDLLPMPGEPALTVPRRAPPPAELPTPGDVPTPGELPTPDGPPAPDEASGPKAWLRKASDSVRDLWPGSEASAEENRQAKAAAG